jgi:uncharacterized membrane protein affecting hemolysin expression
MHAPGLLAVRCLHAMLAMIPQGAQGLATVLALFAVSQAAELAKTLRRQPTQLRVSLLTDIHPSPAPPTCTHTNTVEDP